MSEEKDKIEEFIITLNNMRSDLEKALAKQIDVDRFISVLIFYLKKNIGLLDKDRQSLVNSIREAATDGLLVDGREGYISPYKGVLKFGAMTAGIVKKLALAGVAVNPQVVYKNDKFEYWTDELGQHINHKPDILGITGNPRGDMIGAYSIAKTSDGFTHIEIMSKDEIEKVKAKSNNKDGLMWKEFPDEGAKKSVIRRGYKWLPKNPKLDDFFKREDEQEYDFTDQLQEIKPARTTTRVEEIINNSNKDIEKGQAVKQENNGVAPIQQEIPYSPTGARLAKEPEPELKIIEGVITAVKIKTEGNNARYVCQIGDLIYGTDTKAMYEEAIVPLFQQKQIIQVHFTERETSDMIYRDIIKILLMGGDKPISKNTPKKKELPL